MTLKVKDIITSQDLTPEELHKILNLAKILKQKRFDNNWRDSLLNKTFLMVFYNPSLRTHLSFSVAMTELGGNAIYLDPSNTRIKIRDSIVGESIEDAAKVMSRYVAGIGIRIAEDQVKQYGEGHQILLEYAKWSDVPVINMATDKFHPCQGLADIMGWMEWFGKDESHLNFEVLKGKNFLLTWGTGKLARGWCSVQESLLVASRFGLNVTIARPSGYDLDY
jgi:N-acetylornithine carbamoyltransferase